MFVTYEIRNVVNNHRYVGSSSQFEKRKERHLKDLIAGKHHSIYLQRAFNKYGIQSFSFTVLSYHNTKDSMKQAEQTLLETNPDGYNVSRYASGGDNISYHPRHIQICEGKRLLYQAVMAANNGIHPTRKFLLPLVGERNHNWRGGISKRKCATCDAQIKSSHIRCSSCNKIWLREIRKGEGNHFYGKRHSVETKQILRQKQLGIKPPNRRKVKIGEMIYDSCTDAARALGVTTPLILYRIKSVKYPDYEYYLEGSTTSRKT